MKILRLLFLFSMVTILFGCSPNEMLSVGDPVEGQINFHTEITDKEKIDQVRRIFQNLESINEPNNLNNKADTFISIRKDAIQEIFAYIWYMDDGSSITMRPHNRYYYISKEETDKLKGITH